MNNAPGVIGFTCAYTPLPLIHAAGFTPYRVLPVGECPDKAGHILHDNLCPHVKLVLDRAMGGSIPPLAGMVFMNSCDSMRRLHDAWRKAMPGMSAVLADLPATVSDAAVEFFRGELGRTARFLEGLGGRKITDDAIREGIVIHDRVSSLFEKLGGMMMESSLPGGAAALQEAYNRASTTPPGEAIEYLEGLVGAAPAAPSTAAGMPVFLFGNVLPEPEAFALFESCGARIVSGDVCTGARLFSKIGTESGEDALLDLARGLMAKEPCARTFDAEHPGNLGDAIAERAKRAGARGVIGYTAKFCDPYIARMPGVREALRSEGIPFLLLEGDCTLRSIGQQRTRIEAFIEMAG